MTHSTPRRRWLTLAVVPVAIALTLSACASGSVSGKTAAPSASASGGQFASIIPKGDIVAFSKKLVDGSLNASTGFTPLSTGPTAQDDGAHIAFVGSDLTNGGVNTVLSGVEEAAKVIGWKVDVFDGKATAQGRSDALNQAVAGKPVAIIAGGFDATEQSAAIATAKSANIPVIGWHAAAAAGPGDGLFTNVTTDPLVVS